MASSVCQALLGGLLNGSQGSDVVTLASFVMRFVELSVPKTAAGAHDFKAVRKVGT